MLLLAAGQWVRDDTGRSPLMLAVAFHFASNVGWLYFSPSANAVVAGSAPPSVRGAMLGVYMLSVFFGSLISGRLGGLYETLSPAQFWSFHAGLVGLGGLGLMAFEQRLARWLPAPTRRRLRPRRTMK